MKKLLLLLFLTSCQTQVITPIPELPNEVIKCNTNDHEVRTNEDLVYLIYDLRNDFKVCSQKHTTVINMYNNLRRK